jgi:ribonuclease HI
MTGDDVDSHLPEVTIYTDGACNPNPGPGGWAAVLLFPGQDPQELVGSEADTTNNRMEIHAATEALASLPVPHRVHLYTDSRYLRQGITEWMPVWEKRNWRTTAGADVKSQDLWRSLASQIKRHRVEWHWTRGHAGNRWNERANNLAQSVLPTSQLPLEDEGAIHIFTAASYLGQLGRGGWGVVLKYRQQTRTLSGSAHSTSSNRLHLQAAVEGLRAIKQPLPIHLYTASDYLKDGATLWLKIWSSHNWQTKEGKPVSHRDLWETLADLCRRYQVVWHVMGKDNPPDNLVQARRLASEAAHSEDLRADRQEVRT